MSDGWASYSTGVLDHEGQPLLLIDVPAIISGPLDLAA